MAKCIDCLHFEVCKYKLEEICKFTKIEDLIHNCTKFRDRTKYSEVVRCKDCKHCKKYTNRFDPIPNRQLCNRMFDYAYRVEESDFCSYGERREGE